MSETFESLVKKVEDWGNAKGIIDNTWRQTAAQLDKVYEEYWEVHEAAKDFYLVPTARIPAAFEALEKEIGDLLVTIIMVGACTGADPTKCLEKAYEKIKNRTGKVVDGQFVKDAP